jgi:hypothetical protein
VELQDITFADGQLRFRLPRGWIESAESDGGSAFYDEGMDRGTLRVKVMTFTTEDDLTGHPALDELAALESEPGQSLQALPNGNALRFHREEAQASGEPTIFHVWLLASIDPPHRMRLAVFSFTVLARDLESASQLVATLEKEIREARFAHQVS